MAAPLSAPAPSLDEPVRIFDEKRRVRAWVLGGTVLLTTLRFAYAISVGLAPQEAYYWQYGRHPALSYLDHPAMSAWWIRFGTWLFGNTPLGVRFCALLSGALFTLLLYRLGERLFSPRAGLWTWGLANATVLGAIGTVVITPDVPMLLFWTAALLVLAELVLDFEGPTPRTGSRRIGGWYLLGLLVGLALLSKYPAGLLFPSVLVAALATPKGRAALKTAHPYLAALLGLACFTPAFVWNARHHFASFAFQTTGRLAGVHGIRWVLVGRYLGLQTLAVGPLLYLGVWVAAGVAVLRFRSSERWRWVAAVSLPTLLLFTFVSPFEWVKMNWPAPAYVGLWVGLAAWLAEQPRRKWLGFAALVTSGVLALATYLMPLVPAVPFSERDNLISGWHQLARRVQKERFAAKNAFVVGTDYKTASELAFDLPDQPETTSQNVFDLSGLMYGFWAHPSALEGRDAVVISDRRRRFRDAARHLRAHCASVRPLAPQPVFRGPHLVTTFDLWRCEGYHAKRAAPRGGKPGIEAQRAR